LETESTEIPRERSSHGTTIAGDNIYILGGNCGKIERQLLKDFWKFNLESKHWTQLPDYTHTIFRNSLTYDPTTHSIYNFAGGIPSTTNPGALHFLNEIWSYSVENKDSDSKWVLIETKEAPTPRGWHVAVSVPGRIYIFGGIGDRAFFNDLWYFDLSSKTWHQVKQLNHSENIIPCPRAHAAAAFHESKREIYVFGGIKFFGTKGYLHDLWKFNLDSCAWEEVTKNSVGKTCPPLIAGHSAVVSGNHLLIFGGNDMDGKYINDIWQFDFDTTEWRKLDVNEPLPEKRSGQGAVEHKGNVIIYGGYNDIIGKGPQQKNDIWSFTPPS